MGTDLFVPGAFVLASIIITFSSPSNLLTPSSPLGVGTDVTMYPLESSRRTDRVPKLIRSSYFYYEYSTNYV